MKKLLSLILCMIMVLTTFIVPAGSAEIQKPNEPTTQEMEAIIKIVRPKIDVPWDFTEFQWHYSSPSYYSRATWHLSWNKKDYSGHISISCDTDGNITSYDYYRDDFDRIPSLPDKAPEEYLPTVEAFIKKTVPYASGKISLTETNSNSLRNHCYNYIFNRTENGIIVPDNFINISIDYTNSTIRSFSANFDIGASFENKENIITEEKAKEILGTKQKMVLSYKLKTEWNDEDGTIKSRKAYLVYTPETSYISVDAVTGEIYTERNTWSVVKDGLLAGSGSTNGALKDSVAEDSSAEREYQLSESELEQLKVLEGLISKDEAIKSVISNKFLYINEKANAVDANLRKNSVYGQNKDEQKYIWEISFSNPSDEKFGHYDYMSATVDAKTGELLYFYANLPNYYYYKDSKTEIPVIKYTHDQAKAFAEEFLKTECKEKFEFVRFTNEPIFAVPINYIEKSTGIDGEIISEPVYRSATYNYVRINEGIDFNYNNINAKVDLVTGKIVSFGENWYDDVEFESPKDAITPEKALLSLYSYDGFGLNYEVNSNYIYNKYLADNNTKGYVDYDKLYETNISTRLVYSLYSPESTIIDALTGSLINYSGEEIKKADYSYTDISGHWAEEIIKRFAYVNIGFDGEKFLPDNNITPKEFIELLSKCSIFGTNDKVDEKSTALTRTDAVKFLINFLGYEKIASLENVFITDFADNTLLMSEDVGYIAIARGFKLIEGDGNSFRPYDSLTRAEAMQLCYKVFSNKMID